MESDHNKKFDQQVRKKFEGFSVEAPSSLWAGIEKELEPGKANVRKISVLKRYPYISVAAALLIIGFVIWKAMPEEKVFLQGQKPADESAFIQAPEVKQPIDDAINPMRIESKNKVVAEASLKPASAALVKSDDEEHSLASSGRVTEQNTEGLSLSEPHLLVSASIDNDEALLSKDADAASFLVTTTDTGNDLTDSIDHKQDLVEAEPEARQKIVSGILNFVAANIQIGDDRRVQFSENEHGIIKIGLKR